LNVLTVTPPKKYTVRHKNTPKLFCYNFYNTWPITCSQSWSPPINGLVDDALNSAQSLIFCKVVWRRYFGKLENFMHFVANLSKTLYTSISIEIGKVL